jgi:hypothetical protein
MGDLAKAIQRIGAVELAGGGYTQPAKPLVPKAPQGPKPRVVGKGATPAATGGSAREPLIETAYADRTYYATRNIVSSDGVFVMQIKPVKALKFPNGMKIELKEPTS